MCWRAMYLLETGARARAHYQGRCYRQHFESPWPWLLRLANPYPLVLGGVDVTVTGQAAAARQVWRPDQTERRQVQRHLGGQPGFPRATTLCGRRLRRPPAQPARDVAGEACLRALLLCTAGCAPLFAVVGLRVGLVPEAVWRSCVAACFRARGLGLGGLGVWGLVFVFARRGAH